MSLHGYRGITKKNVTKLVGTPPTKSFSWNKTLGHGVDGKKRQNHAVSRPFVARICSINRIQRVLRHDSNSCHCSSSKDCHQKNVRWLVIAYLPRPLLGTTVSPHIKGRSQINRFSAPPCFRKGWLLTFAKTNPYTFGYVSKNNWAQSCKTTFKNKLRYTPEI